MVRIKLKDKDKSEKKTGLCAVGFGSIQVTPPTTDGYCNVIDHCGRDEQWLIDLLKRCDDVDDIVVV